jgi:hypothetical protein
VALMVQYLAANETGQTAGARFDPLLQLHQFQKSANAVNSLS